MAKKLTRKVLEMLTRLAEGKDEVGLSARALARRSADLPLLLLRCWR